MMGPFESMAVSSEFQLLLRWIEAQEQAEVRSLRFASRRWKADESAAVISGADGTLRFIDRFRKHVETIIKTERGVRKPEPVREMKRAT